MGAGCGDPAGGPDELGEELSVYGLSDEDLAIQARAATFAEELIPFEVDAEMAGGELPPEWSPGRRSGPTNSGWRPPTCRVELGGGGCSTLQQVLVQEQMGRVTNALGWVAATPPSWLPPWPPRTRSSTSLRPAVAGEREECYAITEEGAGSDVAALVATARRDGDEYVLNGESSGTSRHTTRPTSRSSRRCWPAARTPVSTRCSWSTCPAPG